MWLINCAQNVHYGHPLFTYLHKLREWCHDLSSVWLDDTGEKWNGSWNCLRTKESENSKLCKTAIVNFSTQSPLLLFIGHLGVEVERIVKVEWNIMGDGIESGVLSNLSALGVVGKTRVNTLTRCKFGVKLKESNEKNDLNTGSKRKSIPLLRGGKISGGERSSIQGHGPWEVDVGLNAVSNEGGHGNTSVLDLGLTEPSNGEFIALSPEGGISKTKRIPVAYDGVKLLSKGLKVTLGLGESSTGHRLTGGGKSGSRANKSCENSSKFHFFFPSFPPRESKL
mmetsp:Transcript_42664/g.62274  ORF Transcript_42664/g.62274 Transcript_42664/m.62274 type:complete len:282 (+) Transcript_42664:181-1026(+)